MTKGVYFGEVNGINGGVKHSYIKYSAVNVSAQMQTENPAYKALVDAVIEIEKSTGIRIDEIVFDSAVKLSRPKDTISFTDLVQAQKDGKVGELFTKEEKEVEGEQVTTYTGKSPSILTMFNDNFGMQYNPYAKVDNKVTMPSQLSYFLNILGENNAMADRVYGAHAMLMALGATKALKSSSNMASFIQQKLSTSDTNIVESNYLNDGVSINNPFVENKVVETFLSTLSKMTSKVKFPGSKLVLQSDIGYKHKLKYRLKDESKGVYDEKGNLNKDNILYVEAAFPKGVLPKDLEDLIIKGERGNTKNYADVFGFRIPSTDLHSGIPIRVTSIHSNPNTNLVILPQETSALMGSDFDVDSLFVIRPTRAKEDISIGSVSLKKDQEIGRREDNGLLDTSFEEALVKELARTSADPLLKRENRKLKDLQKEYLLNVISLSFLEVLQNPINASRIITPIAKEVFEERAASLFKSRYKKTKVTSLSRMTELVKAFKAVKDGAFLTGVFANNIKVLSYMARSGKDETFPEMPKRQQFKYTNESKTMSFTKYVNFDMKGKKIWDSLDALVNLAIDNAKDLGLRPLSITEETGNA